MLSTRLFFGLSMVAGLLLALCVDEWLAPWYPFWFVLSGFALVAAARELVGLLDATSAAPVGQLGDRRGAGLAGRQLGPARRRSDHDRARWASRP